MHRGSKTLISSRVQLTSIDCNGGVSIRKDVVIVGIKTNEEADKAVLEMDAAVGEIVKISSSY